MTRSINYGFYNGQMTVTQRQGTFTCTCISKEGKDKPLLKNWRPITLWNAVCKFASSRIPARLKTVLPKLIGKDQKAFSFFLSFFFSFFLFLFSKEDT